MSDKRRTANDTTPPSYIALSRPPTSIRRGTRIASAERVYDCLKDFAALDREHLFALDLDVRHRLIEKRIVHVGTLTSVECHPRDIFRPAIVNSAAAIIVAHNHPSGDPNPSRQDLDLTARLRQVGDLVGISLLDHVILASDGFLSLAQSYWS